MHLFSINIGKAQPIANGGKSGVTGIFKQPARGAVRVGNLGLEGDAVVNKKHHGGPDQAVYVYGADDYAWWSAELGFDLEPGTFGDNLTVSNLEASDLNIGDRLHIGDQVVLEISAARIPCATLAARMDDSTFVKRFRHAERPGIYCRVIQGGAIDAGDGVTLETYSGATITVREMFQLYYDNSADEAAIRRVLAAPIAIRARQDNEERLAKITA